MQIMLGSYVLANDARPEVITQLSLFGLCMGRSGIPNVFNTLTGYQQSIRQHAGKEVPLETRLVYDNVHRDAAGLSDLVREARDQRRKENEGPASRFMALSTGGVIGVGGVDLPVDPRIWEMSSNNEVSVTDQS
jgi:hypothetical protein